MIEGFMDYKGKKVLVTGGLGFLGSNTAIRLVEQGADVTIVDAMIPEYGGNLFNIEPIKSDVHVNFSNICDEHSMNHLVQRMEYIFHFAGQVNHIMSLSDPFPDIEMNIKGTAVLLEACKRFNREAVITRAGTRGQYGPSTKLPVNEDAPTNPRGIYEISHLTAERIMQAYQQHFGIRSVLLRLTNIYGPRGQMKTDTFGVANWFIRQAIDGQTIKVFGDGKLKRDFLYVDDSVEAILQCGSAPSMHGEIVNVGKDTPETFLELAETIIRVAKRGRWEFAAFTPERRAQEPGDFYSDITKIRSAVGWSPRTSLDDGVAKTVEYYDKFRAHYW
jgi:UDP-glucose 4-epimerase